MVSDAKSWPSVDWEECEWRSSLNPDAIPRAARRRHSGPYRAAIVPAISKVGVALPSATQSLADQATAEISRFDAVSGAITAPFASLLLRTESASSSQIENITAGAKAIAMAELNESGKLNARLNVANVRSMRAALQMADSLDADAILQMHATLLGGTEPRIAGVWRDRQVWIGGSNYGPHGAEFVPPAARRVPDAIDDLIRFMRRDDLPVLTQAAIAHAQFETIHPFLDGNGRTGRALVHSLLKGKGLVREVTVPVSAGLLADTRSYFDALTGYREGDPAAIVERFAHASLAAVDGGRRLASAIGAIRAGWGERIQARRDACLLYTSDAADDLLC